MWLSNLSIYLRKSLRINPRGKCDEVLGHAQSVRMTENHEIVNKDTDVVATIPDEDEKEINTDMFNSYQYGKYNPACVPIF